MSQVEMLCKLLRLCRRTWQQPTIVHDAQQLALLQQVLKLTQQKRQWEGDISDCRACRRVASEGAPGTSVVWAQWRLAAGARRSPPAHQDTCSGSRNLSWSVSSCDRDRADKVLTEVAVLRSLNWERALTR